MGLYSHAIRGKGDLVSTSGCRSRQIFTLHQVNRRDISPARLDEQANDGAVVPWIASDGAFHVCVDASVASIPADHEQWKILKRRKAFREDGCKTTKDWMLEVPKMNYVSRNRRRRKDLRRRKLQAEKLPEG